MRKYLAVVFAVALCAAARADLVPAPSKQEPAKSADTRPQADPPLPAPVPGTSPLIVFWTLLSVCGLQIYHILQSAYLYWKGSQSKLTLTDVPDDNLLAELRRRHPKPETKS